MKFKLAISSLTLAVAAAGSADTLKINFENYGTHTVQVFAPISGTGHDNSFNGTLNGTTTLPVLFCFDLFQELKVPETMTVTVVHHFDAEAWVIAHASTILSGAPADVIDAATQLAVWTLEYPTFTANSIVSPIDMTDAGLLVAADGNGTLKMWDTEYIFNNGNPTVPGGPNGQSMITVGTPGPLAFAPFAIGLIGLLRRRRTA